MNSFSFKIKNTVMKTYAQLLFIGNSPESQFNNTTNNNGIYLQRVALSVLKHCSV